MGNSIVQRLDHISIRTAAAPEALYAILTEQLLMPPAWPVRTHAFFSTGSIHLGDTRLEILQAGAQREAARLYGLAFALPDFAESLPILTEARIPHTPPLPYYVFDEQGWQTAAWSSVYLGGLLDHSPLARLFFRASHAISRDRWEQASLPTSRNRRFILPLIFNRVYRSAMFSAVEYNPSWYTANLIPAPGPVGLEVTGIYEVTVGSSRFNSNYRVWKKLLEGHPEVVEGVWRLPGDTHIRLTPSAQEGLSGLILKVESINRAAQFLYRRELIGEEKDKSISINPEKIQGLDIRVIQG